MQTVRVGRFDNRRSLKASPVWMFTTISHGRGMTRMEANASVWPWERTVEEAGRWVGLPREHPVYRGGPEKSMMSWKPSSRRRKLEETLAIFQRYEPQTTYTRNILSSDDVSHSGHNLILAENKM